jgi:hypothetical protein
MLFERLISSAAAPLPDVEEETLTFFDYSEDSGICN